VTFWRARDPRAKVLAAVALSFALAVAPGPRVLAALPVTALLLLTAGLGRPRLLAALRAVAVLWLLSLLANAFLIPGDRIGPELLRWARPTREGITAGLAQGARLAALTAVASWAAATTRTLELASSLEWSVRGIPGLRRRAHRALLPIVLSLRMLPLLLDEARRLLDVDRLRQGPRRGWRGARRVAGLGPVWVLLVVERAEALALALTLRGYRPDRERSFARDFRLGALDWGLMAATALGVYGLGRG
jgi:energy-coupling factor transport system permease protein